jgi:hypothetical protein
MMNGRIAIMTWHHAKNYGTAFQVYALKNAVENMGYTVDLIDYRRKYSAPLKRRSLGNLAISKGRFLLSKWSDRKKAHFNFSPECFDSFYDNYFTYTPRCSYNQEFDELNLVYDGFICGSDQIWGPEWFNPRYFLDFVYDDNRKIAYAPSFGVSEIKDGSIRIIMSELIGKFQFLSVREDTGCSIAAELTGREDVFNALDPALLLKVDDWSKIEQDLVLPSGKYMLIFFLKNNPDYFEIAIEAAKMKGLEPIILHCTQSEDSEYANIGELSPGQLLKYISSASYICTDSFHISVLSITYNIQFKSFKKSGKGESNSKNNRITDLVNRLSIKNVEYEVGCSFEDEIDYNQINERLSEQRDQSFNFLFSALSGLPKSKRVKAGYACECVANEGNTGTFSKAFQHRLTTTQSNRDQKLLARMKSWNFALERKCYNCREMSTFENNSDKREPLFYKQLNIDLLNDGLSIRKIYKKYYWSYDLPHRLKAACKK